MQVKTDNSFLFEKVKLRLDNLPQKAILKVLDCFCGRRVIWKTIQSQRPDIIIEVTGIDVKNDKGGLYLVGNNVKFLMSMDLSTFDIIDLDAYGIPFAQAEALFKNKTASGKIVFATVNQIIYGCLNKKMLNLLGYSSVMIKKIPALFNRNGIQKFFDYLSLRGVTHIKHYYNTGYSKNYIMYNIPQRNMANGNLQT